MSFRGRYHLSISVYISSFISSYSFLGVVGSISVHYNVTVRIWLFGSLHRVAVSQKLQWCLSRVMDLSRSVDIKLVNIFICAIVMLRKVYTSNCMLVRYIPRY